MSADRPSHRTLPLALGALGVVYGDIGTSPLYAFRECVHTAARGHFAEAQAFGAVSLIAWALFLLVTIKYLGLVLRADNQGEGGILALLALVSRRAGGTTPVLVGLGAFGAALLYGDGILTPAVTVLGAMEGLTEAWPAAGRWVIPGTVVVLAGLFLVQRHGTGRVGSVFGPIMVVWFLTLAALGVASIARTPEILGALDPRHGLRFLTQGGMHGFAILGSVFLAVTGAEALYADLGHFGGRPIRLAWGGLVLPSLLLNYFGQAALVVRQPSAAVSPFFRLAPEPLQGALVLLATAAGVVASQALISAAFSLTMQASQLGFLPRMDIQHTSARQRGQIYIAPINVALAAGCIGLVLAFRSSGRLAAAYGIAVSLTMVITTILLWAVARHRWGWSDLRCLAAIGTFLVADLAFLSANLLKVHDGGWLPLVLGGALFVVMTTWRRGREVVVHRLRARAVRLEDFVEQVRSSSSVRRVPGTAVFLSASPDGTPVALLHNLKHNRVVHERVVVLRFAVSDAPHLEDAQRLEFETLPAGFWRITATFGFMEEPSLDTVRAQCELRGLGWKDMHTTYFLGRETFIRARHPVLPGWRAALFRLLSRNARQPTAFFRLPPNRVVELGAQVEL